MTTFLQALNHLINTYLMMVASAIAANAFLRSFFEQNSYYSLLLNFESRVSIKREAYLAFWQWFLAHPVLIFYV